MIDYFIHTYGPTLAITILCAIFGTLGHVAKRIYVNHINDETKRSTAAVVAQFVEQAWKTLHGEEKLNKALETAEVLLKKKGIDFDAEEMKVLIEAAVSEFNDAFYRPIKDSATTEAVRRTYEDDREESGLLDDGYID